MDLDSILDLFGLADGMDIDIPDDGIDVPGEGYDNVDLDDEYLIDDSLNENGSNISFGKKNCPPNADSDGYIYHSEVKYKDYKVFKKHGKWWIWTENDIWQDITKFINK